MKQNFAVVLLAVVKLKEGNKGKDVSKVWRK